MEQIKTLEALGLFNARVPRYTSYPTAAVFTANTGAAFHKQSLAALDPDDPVSVYIHIPFCHSLCYYCGCNKIVTQRKQRAQTYLNYLYHEIELISQHIQSWTNKPVPKTTQKTLERALELGANC